MTWLVRDDDVLAVAEVAASRGQRTRGLMGRDEFEGALVIRPCRQVHTFGMRFPDRRRVLRWLGNGAAPELPRTPPDLAGRVALGVRDRGAHGQLRTLEAPPATWSTGLTCGRG